MICREPLGSEQRSGFQIQIYTDVEREKVTVSQIPKNFKGPNKILKIFAFTLFVFFAYIKSSNRPKNHWSKSSYSFGIFKKNKVSIPNGADFYNQ